jgi:hypothetical protein
MSTLRSSRSPNLSNAAQVYQPQFFDQVFRQFRVYFNEIDNFLSNISGPYGGDYLTFSYGSFYDTTDQTAANTTTAYAVSFNSTDISQQVSIASSSQITFDVAGTYNIQFSIQLSNSTNDTQDVDIWFRLNGSNIANSNSRYGLPARKSSGDPSHTIAVVNFLIAVAVGDYVQIMWRPSDTGVKIEYHSTSATPDRPAVPSAIVTVTRVSAPAPNIYG